MNIFKTKNGDTVIAQRPNLPIIGWFVFLIIAKLTSDNLSEYTYLLSSLFLWVWCALEILYGVNTFRRILGIGVLALSLYGRFL